MSGSSAASALRWHEPDSTGTKILRRSFAAALVLEVVVLLGVGWHEHWLAHPSKPGLDTNQFIEAQVFEVPKEAAHLVDTTKPTSPREKREKAISKAPNQGRKSKDQNKLDEQNQTHSAPPMAPTHGPVALFAPAPTIPPYLRDKDLHASVVIDFYVNARGAVTPRLAGSSGNEELDAIALETAKKWQFRPAEKDHKPVDAKVRLRIVFEVQ